MAIEGAVPPQLWTVNVLFFCLVSLLINNNCIQRTIVMLTRMDIMPRCRLPNAPPPPPPPTRPLLISMMQFQSDVAVAGIISCSSISFKFLAIFTCCCCCFSFFVYEDAKCKKSSARQWTMPTRLCDLAQSR